jgi:hypothetical protein
MDFSTTLDLIISALLIGTIGYAFALNRTLLRVREGREGMEQLIRDLSTAVARAESAIGGLKDAASKADNELNARIRTARDLVNDLEIINESGNGLAVRLEGAVKIARAMQAAPGGREPETREPARAAQPVRSPVKTPVPPAKVADRAAMGAPAAASSPEPTPRRTAAAVSQRATPLPIAEEEFAEEPAVVPFKAQAARPARAEMERELFDALETLRQGRS